ncbi:MAG: PQQ-binding-like beta-propeller repeat protein [Phycisphaeraceae bacterium]|nr:PQQ-binding-like beta-propeller repeat protein [Phycisphaeraceae bacterium]
MWGRFEVEVKRSVRAWLFAFVLLVGVSAPVVAQVAPVYPDDSVQARETLSRVDDLLGTGNLAESSRVIQALLDGEGDKVLESKDDGDVFFSVREHIHKLLLSRPALLERYRATEGPRADKLLEEGKFAEVERARLLTAAGFEAALRVAQTNFEAAQFEAARLTLEQLEHHPDRSGKGGRDAAALAAKVSRYLPREDVRHWADRWLREAGAGGGVGDPIDLPAGLDTEFASPRVGGKAPEWDSLPEAALVSSVLARRASRDGEEDEDDVQVFEIARQSASRAWMMPVVVDDLVIVNNGAEISGLDRFTLSPVWSIRPAPSARSDFRRDSSRQGPPLSRLEESAWVIVSGPVGVASMGYVTETGREGDRRLIAFDIRTGRVLWSVDPATLDRRLEGCSVRGEPVVSEGVLIVPMRRNSSVRRVSGAVLAGLDIWTGKLRWVRPLCSVGVMPFNRAPRAAERCVAADGIVYRADGLGIVAAVEAASGRVVWVRRMNPPGDLRTFSVLSLQASNQPWAGSEPVLDGTSLITLTPDASAIVRLSAVDGTMLGRRNADDLGDATTLPSYLMRVKDRLIVVTADRVISLPLSGFEKSNPVVSPSFREPAMVGRMAALSGGQLLVPLEDRLLVFDAADLKQAASHPITKTGNIIALGDGLLVADSGELHAFLKWETAEAILSKRLAATPDDPSPALSMMNLAFRAQKYPSIVPAVDRVLEIRDRLPDSTAAQAARRRLIDSLRNMFAAGKQRWDPAADQRASGGPIAAPSVQVLSELALRFARGAESPAELAEYELTLGWLGEAKGAPASSLEAYTRILSDDSLGGSTVAGEFGVPVRASEMATDRLLALVKRQGPDIYAAFAAQAARELEELGEQASPAELVALARRYPAAPAAASAWSRLAEAYTKNNRRPAAARALALAMRALEYSQSSRAPELAAEGRHVATRLVETLAALDRASEAVRVANEASRIFSGGPIAVPSVASDRLLSGNRRARFGDRVQPDVQSLVGWLVAEPKITEGPGRPTDRVVMTSPGRKQVGLFVTSLTDGRLEPRWVRNYEQRQPRVIRIDQSATYLYWPAESRPDRAGGVIERIRNDGTSAWLSREVAGMLDEIELRLPDDAAPFVTPLDGSVSPGDLLVAMDAGTLILIERVGRIVSIDLESGKPLWSTRIPSIQVYDGAISAGTLIVGGASTERPDARVGVGAGPISLPAMTMFALDARKGGTPKDLRPILSKLVPDSKVSNRSPGDRQQVRWLRSLGGGRVLVGMYDRVVAIDAPAERVLWSYEKPSVGRSLECWIVGDRAFVLNDDHAIVGLTLGDGSSPVGELDSKERIQTDSAVGVVALPDGSVAFASSRGVAVFERDGKLIGMDSGVMAGEATAQLFALGADKVAMIPDEEPDRTLDLRILALPSGKLVSSKPVALSRPPSALHAVDGRLILTAGGISMVLPAPAEPDNFLP